MKRVASQKDKEVIVSEEVVGKLTHINCQNPESVGNWTDSRMSCRHFVVTCSCLNGDVVNVECWFCVLSFSALMLFLDNIPSSLSSPTSHIRPKLEQLQKVGLLTKN